MARRPRRNHSPAFKAKWPWQPSKARGRWPSEPGSLTYPQPDHPVAPAVVGWRCRCVRRHRQGRDGAGGVCEDPSCEDWRADVREGFFVLSARQGRSVGARKATIERDDRLSIGHQAQLLGLSRGSVSYLLRPTSQTDLALMRRIDALHLDDLFAGSRVLQGLLKAAGYEVGRLRVSTLAEDGDRGALPPPEDLDAGAGTQDPSLPAARPHGQAP